MRRTSAFRYVFVLGFLLGAAQPVLSAEKTIDIYALNDNRETKGIGEKIGTITFQDSKEGLMIRPHLKGLTPGEHGFHVHANASCEGGEKNSKWVPGLKAGGHYDPLYTKKHRGPNGKGHLGDLPVLVVDKDGNTQFALQAKRLNLSDLNGHSVVIHQGGDNYTDEPAMGGGGDRIACGVIQ